MGGDGGVKVNSKKGEKERNWDFPGKDTALDCTACTAFGEADSQSSPCDPATRFELE